MTESLDETTAEYLAYHVGDQLGRTLNDSLAMQEGFRRLVEITLEGTREEALALLQLITDETAKEFAGETAAQWLAGVRLVEVENSRWGQRK